MEDKHNDQITSNNMHTAVCESEIRFAVSKKKGKNNMSNVTSGNRIPKDDIRNWRRKFNGATKRCSSTQKKLQKIDKELRKISLSSTRRKILQTQRIELLAKFDDANVDLQLSKQRVNHYLDHNKKIISSERVDNRKEANVKMRAGKLSFSLQSFLKTAALPAEFNVNIVAAIRENDLHALGNVLSEQVKSDKSFKYKLPKEKDEARTILLISMMKWFKSRFNIETEEAPVTETILA